MNSIYVKHAAEIYTASGPTGRFVEVTAGRVEDYGGNVLIAGNPTACVLQRVNPTRRPTRLIPTAWELPPAGAEIVGAEYTWSPVVM